jgi:microcystin-dependent protein
MGGKPSNSSDTATQAHRGGKHSHHRNKHPSRPCPNPPAAPQNFVFTFKVRETKTHLEYSGKLKWDGVTQDEQGHKIPGGGVQIDRYQGMYWPTDSSGAAIETEDGHPRTRRFHVPSVKGIKVIDAKMISGTTAEFTTKKAHGYVVGEIVRVQDVKPSGYNGKFTVLSAGLTATTFRVDIGVVAPKDLEDEGNVEGQPDPNYNFIVEHIPNPKKWWWKAKVRAWDNKNCPSDWTTIGPFKPTQEARPQPPAPGFVSLTFDRKGGKKHDAFRGKIKITPVLFWDIPGYDAEDDVSRYHARIQVSNDGLTDWRKHRNIHVRDTDDEKEDDDKILMVFHGVRRRNYYRVWLSSTDRFNRKGNESGPWPSSVGIGIGGTPDPVQNVSITKPAPRRLVAKWDEPATPEDIDYYKIEWWRRNPLTLMETNKVRNRRDVYRVPEADKGKAHFCKVYAVDEDDNASTPVQPGDENEAGDFPAGAVTNPPNVPSNPTLSFDGRGTRHAKYRAVVTAGTSTADATHDAPHRYVIQLAHDAVDGGANPPAGTKRQHGSVEGDATGDDLFEIFRNIPKKRHVWVRERARNAAGASAWTNWVHATRPVDTAVAVSPAPPTGVTVTAPAPRRVKVTWDDPENIGGGDDDVSRWRVDIRRGGSVVESGFTRSTRYIYHVPKQFAGQVHNAHVYAFSDTGTISGLQLSNDGTPLDDAAEAAPGTISKHGGNVTPSGWLRCNGNPYSTAAPYDALFLAIGYTYGGGGGTFNVPDFRKRHPRGVGDIETLGDSEGLTESTRDNDHDKHKPHKTHGAHGAHDNHNGHGGHQNHGGHSGHDNHNQHQQDNQTDSADHTHGAGGLYTGGPSTSQSNIAAQGIQSLATNTHSHNVAGNSGGRAANHSHDHNYRHDYTQFSSGHAGHGGHSGHNEHFSGEHDAVAGQGHSGHGGHAGHAEHDLDEHDNDPTKGHRGHPHLKVHYIIKM